EIDAKRTEGFTHRRQGVGDNVGLLPPAAVTAYTKEWDSRILFKILVADYVIVQEVLEYDERQRTAKSQKECRGINHLFIRRYRRTAHYHGLVNDALFNDIGCNRDAGLGPLLQQVIVYVIAKVVTP